MYYVCASSMPTFHIVMKLISGGWPSKFNGFRYGSKEHVIGPFQTMELNFSLSVQMHAGILLLSIHCDFICSGSLLDYWEKIDGAQVANMSRVGIVVVMVPKNKDGR